MKLIIRIILIAGIGFFASLLLNWWIIAVVSFLVAFFIHGNNFASFLSGFLGAGLLWMAYAWKIDTETSSIMSEQMVSLMSAITLGYKEGIILVIYTGLIGGLVGGFSALTGNTLRSIFVKKKKVSLYH